MTDSNDEAFLRLLLRQQVGMLAVISLMCLAVGVLALGNGVGLFAEMLAAELAQARPHIGLTVFNWAVGSITTAAGLLCLRDAVVGLLRWRDLRRRLDGLDYVDKVLEDALGGRP